jgi:hypothetical protein
MLCQEISSGARSALPMRVAPEGIVQKRLFSSIGSKCSVVHHTSPRDTLTARYVIFETLQLRDTLTSTYFKDILPSNTNPPLQREVVFTILENSSPHGYNRNSFIYSLVHLFCTCWRHLFLFLILSFPIFAPRLSPRSFS